jgi:hypothetical protein
LELIVLFYPFQMFAAPLIGMPNILRWYLNALFNSTAILAAMCSDPKDDVSIFVV